MTQSPVNEEILEVCLTASDGNEYIYWVKLAGMPEDADSYDWSIEVALRHHGAQGLPPVPEDDFVDDDEDEMLSSAFASEPFERDAGEFTWAN